MIFPLMIVKPKRETPSAQITRVVIEAVKESMALRKIFDKADLEDDDDFFFTGSRNDDGQVKEDTILYQLAVGG